jgi:hypothetical protein
MSSMGWEIYVNGTEQSGPQRKASLATELEVPYRSAIHCYLSEIRVIVQYIGLCHVI